MRVLTIGRSLPEARTGMLGLFEFNQCKMLKRAGYDCAYIYADNRTLKSNYYRKRYKKIVQGVEVYGEHIPVRPLPYKVVELAKTLSLKVLLKNYMNDHGKPDVIYAHFPVLTLTEEFLKMLDNAGIPLVIMEHWSHVARKKLKPHELRLLKQIAARAVSVCCVSKDLAVSLAEQTSVSLEDIRIIPNAISEELFNWEKRALSRDISFLYVGRLALHKKLSFLLRTFDVAFPQGKEQLFIAGDGILKPYLKHISKRLKASDRIHYLGWQSQEEIADLMKSVNYVVTASENETFCVPIVEAWMCGTKCIAADTISIRDQFDDNGGYLFKAGDAASLVSILRMAASSPVRSKSEGLAKRSAQLFSEKMVVCQIGDCLEGAVTISQG